MGQRMKKTTDVQKRSTQKGQLASREHSQDLHEGTLVGSAGLRTLQKSPLRQGGKGMAAGIGQVMNTNRSNVHS